MIFKYNYLRKLGLIFFCSAFLTVLPSSIFGQGCRPPVEGGGSTWGITSVSYKTEAPTGTFFVDVPAINAAVAQWNTVLSTMPCPNVQFIPSSSFPALTIKTLANGNILNDAEWDRGFVLGGKHQSGEIRINLNSGIVPGAPHLSAPALIQPNRVIAMPLKNPRCMSLDTRLV
jgi:hypothetical protein